MEETQMPFDDLQSFLTALESEGDLKRVKVQVDPELEITEIAGRMLREGGPALIFENVAGSAYPLAINFMASSHRIEIALGRHPEELGEELAHFVEGINPPNVKALWNMRRTGLKLLNLRPKTVRKAPVQEKTESNVDLTSLPTLKCWPDDGGRFITLGLAVSADPLSDTYNMGIYRMQLYDSTTTGMHMQIQKGGGFHYHAAEKSGHPLEMAAVLGGDPALILAAVMPLPEGMDEIAFSGLLRGRRTRVAKSATLGLRVPANAEFILEGTVPPQIRRLEGPFGDHYGHYSEASDFPVFNVRAITRRRDPIYPAAIVGKPPQEDRYIGDAAQLALKPMIRLIHPEVRDIWAYYQAGFHNLLVVSVDTRYTREPLKAALGLLGEGQLSLTKTLILVGPDVDVTSFSSVLSAIRRHFRSEEDFLLIARATLDTLDFTGDGMHLGSKMVLDATVAGRAQTTSAVPIPKDLSAIAPSVLKWRLIDHTLLAVQVSKNGRSAAEAIAKCPLLAAVKIVAVVSEDVDIDDEVSLLWGIFTRFDPARDLVFTQTKLRGSLPIYSGVMVIDATWKKGYPAPLEMSPEIVRRVDGRWTEYWK